MQAVLNSSPAAGRLHMASGRDYMMRSEKRPDPIRSASDPGRKPPRRRRKRAGFFYMLLMTLLLLTLWPLGLLMLWRRKVRWGVITKLLTSIVTLAACVILIGFALTVNTGNPSYTAVQDSVNSFLDSAADTLVNFGEIASERAVEMADDMENVADALWERGSIYLADGIDTGVTLTQKAKNGVLNLVEKLQTTPAPQTPIDEETEAPATPEAQPESSPSPTRTADSTPAANAQATAASAPAETDNSKDADAASTAENKNTVESDDSPTAQPALEPSAESTAEPTAEPTPRIVAPDATLKPPAQATVYHSMNGKWYHSFNRCSGMTGGGAYTLEECAADYKQCRACGAPDPALIGQDCLWMDARKICHTSDECSAFEGRYTLILRDEALEQGLSGCEKCGGNEYLIPNTILEATVAEAESETTE